MRGMTGNVFKTGFLILSQEIKEKRKKTLPSARSPESQGWTGQDGFRWGQIQLQSAYGLVTSDFLFSWTCRKPLAVSHCTFAESPFCSERTWLAGRLLPLAFFRALEMGWLCRETFTGKHMSNFIISLFCLASKLAQKRLSFQVVTGEHFVQEK